jgi:glycosyltransferase involved in cell wall biosynthesis
MKVLLTHDRFAPDFAGGGEYVVLETARHLICRGADVRVLTAGDPAITSYGGVQTTRLPMHQYRFNLAVLEIVRAARGVDLIQTFNYHACLPSLVAGRMARKPVVCLVMGFFQDAWTLMRGPIAGRVFQRWERFLITRPYTRVMFPSEYSLGAGLRCGVDPARALVNSPGIDLNAYAPGPDKDHDVLFVGKLEQRKGIEDLLAVARALPHVGFHVMGWGPERERYERAAPPNVRFTPFERGATLRDAFSRARIFFLPSRAETLGLAVIEAMASGCAIVSSVPLEFEGASVPVGDRPAMAAAIEGLWRDREGTRDKGLQNVALAQRYSWQRYTDTLLATYGEILGRGNGRAP